MAARTTPDHPRINASDQSHHGPRSLRSQSPARLPTVNTQQRHLRHCRTTSCSNAQSGIGGFFRAIGGQFAILSVPQMSLTMRFLNEDADAEFLANPRIVTANNQQATIKITRNQPVPQLNFNEQTAQAVFGGFQDKNTATPSSSRRRSTRTTSSP